MEIKRIDSYSDGRFPKAVLNQHGAYLIDGVPYHIEITAPGTAVVCGKDPAVFNPLIEEFRFHALHIVRYCDESGRPVAEYPPPPVEDIPPERIQPSQFYIDEDKLRAVRTFVRSAEDIVVQVIPYGDRYISLDGHTRLYLAELNGFETVKAVRNETEDWVWFFVCEAERRSILRPGDMIPLPHEQYEIQWNKYCDEMFAGRQP